MHEATTQGSSATIAVVARDIMQRNVTTIGGHATVRELADLLIEREISGVPVIGEDGLVAGVVSLWDVVRLAAGEGRQPELLWMEGTRPSRTQPGSYFLSPVHGHAAGSPVLKTIRAPLLERHRVAEIMTPALFFVHEDTPVPDLARYLMTAKIHRALVMEHGRLVGIVTATDLLEVIARTA